MTSRQAVRTLVLLAGVCVAAACSGDDSDSTGTGGNGGDQTGFTGGRPSGGAGSAGEAGAPAATGGNGASESQLTGCPDGTVPCGNGCRPARDSVCCDDGRRTTSSFCTTAAGGGCYPNDRNCQAVYPSGETAEFCCSPDGDMGSHDCLHGERHCGTRCVRTSEPCCTGQECSSFRVFSDCPEEDNPCGYCRNLNLCLYCPRGSCCASDTCAGPDAGLVCVESEVCVGLPSSE